MAPKIKVGIVGAAGETGKSIVNGLLEDGGFVRPTNPPSLTFFQEHL
jgi:hypothetical protein